MFEVGEIYETKNYGRVLIKEFNGYYKIRVMFLNTGAEQITNGKVIITGQVKDVMSPSVYGVGFLGGTDYPCWLNNKATPAYEAWKGMLRRCYGSDYTKENPSYEGCSVATEWHNYQVFAEWFYKRYFIDCHLDKDIRISGNRVYSEDTCSLVTALENITASNVKNYTFLSPLGDVVSITNLSRFCRDNDENLDPSSMVKVFKGKKKQHKGWTKYFNEDC